MGRGGARIGAGRKPNRSVDTVQLKMGLGTCPKDISPEAKKAWRKWAPIVERLLPLCSADRSVFRNVVRQFGLDPQPRFRWVIEGQTEEGFIRRWAESRVALSALRITARGRSSERNMPIIKASRACSREAITEAAGSRA